MKKTSKINTFFKIVCFWTLLSLFLFAFGYFYPPHSVYSQSGKILGGVFWWSLTIINGVIYLKFQSVEGLSLIMRVIASTTVSSLLVGVIAISIIIIYNFINGYSKYKKFKCFFFLKIIKIVKKIRSIGLKRNNQ